MLQCCVCLSVVCLTLCIVAKRCVLEQKLLLRAYRKRIWEIDWYQNEWPWPLFRGRIKVESTVALHLTLNISETVRFGSKGLPIGNGLWAIEWSRDRWRHVTVKGQTRDPNTLRANISKTTWARDFKFGMQLCMGNAERAHKKFPLKVGVA